MAEADMEIDQVSQACCTSAYVVIVGTEQYYNTYGNKMMFWAPAVRKMLNQGLVRLPNHFFVLHFSDGYSSDCVTAVNAAKDTANATWRNNVQYVECSSIDDVFDFFDTGIVEKSGCDGVKIERVDIYAHGIRDDVSFGFYGSNSSTQSLNGNNYSQLSVDHLSPECRIWSYACRTGNGDTRRRSDLPGFTYSDAALARPENSLAQKLADHTQRDVLAWLTRTYYGGIFNDRGDTGFRSAFVDLADSNSSGRTSNFFGEAFNRLSPFHEEKAGLVLWNTNGSKGEIVGASTPGGLSNTVQEFTAAAP
ncbi:MAG: hypothetical protein ACJA2X_000028 [Halocynthiibacter sp.]|jgi:hypothetical protein